MKKYLACVCLVGTSLVCDFAFAAGGPTATPTPPSAVTAAKPTKPVIVGKETQTSTIKFGPDKEDEIKTELKNPNSGKIPVIQMGSKVTLSYAIEDAKAKKLIGSSSLDKLPTEFEIGKPNIFGDVLNKLVGTSEGATLIADLPPKIGVQNAAAQEFVHKHFLPLDTVLQVTFKVLKVQK